MTPTPLIVCDTREQAPLRFSSAVRVIRGTLATGDYAVVAPDVPEYLTRRRKPTKKDAPPPKLPPLFAPTVAPDEQVAVYERRVPADLAGQVATVETVRLMLLPVAVERKSLPDLVMCATTERERFAGPRADGSCSVLERMQRRGGGVIVVEASLDAARVGAYRSMTVPQSVIGSTIAWQIDYGIPTVWAGDAREAARWVERYLVMALERHVAAEKARLVTAEVRDGNEE